MIISLLMFDISDYREPNAKIAYNASRLESTSYWESLETTITLDSRNLINIEKNFWPFSADLAPGLFTILMKKKKKLPIWKHQKRRPCKVRPAWDKQEQTTYLVLVMESLNVSRRHNVEEIPVRL